ncbi:hypothetical protein [Streptomyces sp. NPDC058667]|uniref:hypothetical protein n=1 Tax=Streptomyces sp. NPDC058667 TaxID=3346588 RepID=UPI003650FAAA
MEALPTLRGDPCHRDVRHGPGGCPGPKQKPEEEQDQEPAVPGAHVEGQAATGAYPHLAPPSAVSSAPVDPDEISIPGIARLTGSFEPPVTGA